jgi:hypothetical protein
MTFSDLRNKKYFPWFPPKDPQALAARIVSAAYVPMTPAINTLQKLADARERSFNAHYYGNNGLPYFKHEKGGDTLNK